MESKELKFVHDQFYKSAHNYKIKNKALINMWSYLNEIENKSDKERGLYEQIGKAIYCERQEVNIDDILSQNEKQRELWQEIINNLAVNKLN